MSAARPLMRPLLASVWDDRRKRRTVLTASASIGATAVVAAAIVAKWPQLQAGITGAPIAVVALAVALQALALVARSEAWRASVLASGGSVSRRRLFRASSMGFVGNLLSSQLSTAARIAALRRSAPAESPRVPTLIAAEVPILAVEAALAALTSFTLVGPLSLPWWLPLVLLAGLLGICAAVTGLAAAKAHWLHSGLAALRTLDGGARLVGFVLVAVLAQIVRNWLMLRAVGIDASLFDAIAVLIAVVTLGQLPFGLSVGTAASVLILGPHGVTAAAAAGVLLTATGTVGGLCFAAWAGLDLLLCDRNLGRLLRRVRGAAPRLQGVAANPWRALAALPVPLRRSVERSYFGGLSHIQITRLLGVEAA